MVGDLKDTVEFVLRELMGPETRIRFRPQYFSNIEPSFEIDFSSFPRNGTVVQAWRAVKCWDVFFEEKTVVVKYWLLVPVLVLRENDLLAECQIARC